MIPRPRQRKGQPFRLQTAHIAAPTGGINTVAAGVNIPVEDSIYSYNLIGAEFGLRTRLGWREWCTGLNGEEVRSLLPFTGSAKAGGNNRLFACTTSGIWDVSASSAAPTQVASFPIQDEDSGYGISTVFVTLAGHFLCYCDESNGYWTYEESTGTWLQVLTGSEAGEVDTGDGGPSTNDFVFVCAWKNRLWFVEKDTGRGWYLAVGAIYGTAHSFTFGHRFKAGGDLRGLWSWTFDGGSGLDDALVAVSGGGDLLIYQGTDPSDMATFALKGVWFVGSVPAGRRICTDFGGDLLVLSSIGILTLSKLVTGLVLYDRSQYRTTKIMNLFNQLQTSTATLRGWSMRLHPQDAALIVLVPTAQNQSAQALVMSLITQGWHQYRDLPIGPCAEPWEGLLYFGTVDGRVCINDGYVDGILLADPNTSTPIQWSLLTGFSNLGRPNLKQVVTIKPRVLSQTGSVPFSACARYGWDMTELATVSGGGTPVGPLWDTALWDHVVWGGNYQPAAQVFGAAGCGAEVAIAIRGQSSSRMTLVGIDVSWDEGGIL